MKSQILIECPVCLQKRPKFEVFSGRAIRESLLPLIQDMNSQWNLDSEICVVCLNKARSALVERGLVKEKGELSPAEREVVEAIKNHELVAENPLEVAFEERTLGNLLADRIATFGGSWPFILVSLSGLGVWVLINSNDFSISHFDPYPFILLNLLLSCLAALQAPIILMSQNRKESKDRVRAEADYKTNLKAELEIRHLHIKIDQLLSQQWHRLIEIQQVQTDLLNDLLQIKK